MTGPGLLLNAAGRADVETAIARIAELAEPDPLRRAAWARRELPGELWRPAVEQWELRQRARVKFGAAADDLWFTQAGLEQASRPEVADHRARRFHAAGAGTVLDLCCGLGGDVLAFARNGLGVTAVERDPLTAALATANTGVAVVTGDAEDADRSAAGSVFIDPARRTARGRTFDPAAFSPAFDFVLSVLADSRLAAAKLSPGLDHALIPADAEAEWVSYGGQVKEAVLWSAGFAESPGRDRIGRRATLLPSGAQLSDQDASTDRLGGIGPFLFEPDGAVIRAGLVQQAAAAVGGWRIDEQLAYLSGNDPAAVPFVRGFAVLDVLPFSVKRLRDELRRREVGTVEIKKRGVDVDPARLRRELKPSGPNQLTVLLARLGTGPASRRVAVLAEPV
ncbi:class I SAM-dependent methyltransferase [Jatrophihabitans telluris]|uniref:Class I SAM-dependent methyltransferase n=1 Tax=Jatrophihabitans telluris TaxID=2038343 RepID=A0ABY4QY41_9ACTN|nr:class I SAM-dependent methyltransferase [Jatrophihabitans telluris]UQX87906.1 class I SAM-dependent methyltransferase [Jatrophihabitans telluris]